MMDILNTLDKKEIREFFSKGWMTHDAMWFYHCLKELGAEQTNRINQAAVASMAGVEMQRILKLMGRGKEPVRTFAEFKEIIDTTYLLIQPEFMKLHYSFPEKNLFRGGFYECFAYEGLKKFGMADAYECGIAARVKGWFDALGVKYEMVPDYTGCLMRDRGKCEIDFRFNLD
jgi:hypothetical protein